MKRKIKIYFLMLFIFTACTKTQIVEDFRIVTSHKKGYNRFVVNYGDRLEDVKLQGVPVESGKTYYVQPGRYVLTYEYIPRISFNFTVNYDKKPGNDRDTRYMDRPQEEFVSIYEDTEMSLDEKNMEVIIQGAGSN